MIISNARKDEIGEWKFDMQLSEEETSFLVELSITSLLKVGMLAINEQDAEQQINLPNQNAPSSMEVQ